MQRQDYIKTFQFITLKDGRTIYGYQYCFLRNTKHYFKIIDMWCGSIWSLKWEDIEKIS